MLKANTPTDQMMSDDFHWHTQLKLLGVMAQIMLSSAKICAAAATAARTLIRVSILRAYVP